MASYNPKIVSEERHHSDTPAKCGPCANKQKKIKAATNVRVAFTQLSKEDSYADMCVTHRKELGQLVSGRIVLGDWPSHMSGAFWRDAP